MKDQKSFNVMDESIDDRILDMVDKLLKEDERQCKFPGQADKDTPVLMINSMPLDPLVKILPGRGQKNLIRFNTLNNPSYSRERPFNDLMMKGSYEKCGVPDERTLSNLIIPQQDSSGNRRMNKNQESHDFYNRGNVPNIQINSSPVMIGQTSGAHNVCQGFPGMQNNNQNIFNNLNSMHMVQNSPTFPRTNNLNTNYFLNSSTSLTMNSHRTTDHSCSPRSQHSSENVNKPKSKRSSDENIRKYLINDSVKLLIISPNINAFLNFIKEIFIFLFLN